MAQITVTILDQQGNRPNEVELPDDVPMRDLIPALVTEMQLPTLEGGQAITYSLHPVKGGAPLGENDTLQAKAIQGGEKLKLMPNFTAG